MVLAFVDGVELTGELSDNVFANVDHRQTVMSGECTACLFLQLNRDPRLRERKRCGSKRAPVSVRQ